MLDLSGRQRLYVYLCAVFLTALLIGDTIGSKLFTVDIPFGFTTLHATLSVGAHLVPHHLLAHRRDQRVLRHAPARASSPSSASSWPSSPSSSSSWRASSPPPTSRRSRRTPSTTCSATPTASSSRRWSPTSSASSSTSPSSSRPSGSRSRATSGCARRARRWSRSSSTRSSSPTSRFCGQIPTARLHQAATTSYIVKVLLAVGLTPVIYALHALIHRRHAHRGASGGRRARPRRHSVSGSVLGVLGRVLGERRLAVGAAERVALAVIRHLHRRVLRR